MPFLLLEFISFKFQVSGFKLRVNFFHNIIIKNPPVFTIGVQKINLKPET